MKTLILSLIFAAGAFAQVVTVGVKIGAAPVQTVTLSPAVVTALTQFAATQTKQDPAFPTDPTKTVPKYVDLADLIMSYLRTGLFQNILGITPPPTIATLKAAVDSAQAALDAAKATAVQ